MDEDRNSNEQRLIYHTFTYYLQSPYANKGISNGFNYLFDFLQSSFGRHYISTFLEEVTNGI